MLMTIRIIITTIIKRSKELIVFQKNVTQEYGTGLLKSCDHTMDNVLGKDFGQRRIDATNNLNKLVEPALNDISLLKTQIEVNFRNEPELCNKMLRALRLTNNYAGVRKGKQTTLIETLIAFKDNADEYTKVFDEKGISLETGTKLAKYADVVRDAETLQEELKNSTPLLTDQTLDQMNDIYDEVISICKIARKIYHDDSLVRKQFTYSHVYKTMVRPWLDESEDSFED